MSFERLLATITNRHPQVLGTIFCAGDGEMVSYHHRDDGGFDTDQLLFVGAMATTWLARVMRVTDSTCEHISLSVSTDTCRYLLVGLLEGYHLVAVLEPDGLTGPVEFSLRQSRGAFNDELV